MANQEHLDLLEKGAEVWNAWRAENPDVRPDLSEEFLYGAALRGGFTFETDPAVPNVPRVGFQGMNLRVADLRRTALSEAILIGADLRQADLRGVDLTNANLTDANLRGANLFGGTNLTGANLTGADLREADFTLVQMYSTVLADVDLSKTKGLDTCQHSGPSIIDHRTLRRSGPLPLKFLRGVGLPDNLIDYLPSLLNQPIQFYSCFISYSSKDDEFAHRIHADLQSMGIRCWFAPHDLPIGARTREAIDIAIRVRDKLLVVLSESSVNSDWVEEEVEIALEEERNSEDRRTILFPIRIDSAIRETQRPWARKLQRERNIGDFSEWKHHDTYQKALERLLRDLKVTQ